MSTQIPTPIAIIGIGCRLPGNVTNTGELWKLLVEGRNAWTVVPSDRYNEAAFYHPNPDNAGTTNHRGGHFLGQNVAAFDAAFFGISPIEAQAIDPQQRILLETTYEAFENAGIPIVKARGSSTAVYTATFTRDYDRNIYKDPGDIPKYHVTGSGEAIVSNRISYTYDLKGPSITLDTGCSGGMVAVHQACQSLQTEESTMALASGVNLILSPDHMFGMSNLHMLNDNGRSYPFDSRGSGYGRGEGVASILLKRLDDALRAGDHVRAVIRNTAINQDGKTNGITLPSQKAQESLQRSVYRSAGLDPLSIRYVEAHGTGTAVGDLAELQGIANIFCGNGRSSQNSLFVGSIKSNIGHLESSSGLASLIKTVLILENGYIPPNADFQTKKKELDFEELKIRIPLKLEPWPSSGVRQASVNSFGYGGTNAHVILESAPAIPQGLERRNAPVGNPRGKDECSVSQDLQPDALRAVITSRNGPSNGIHHKEWHNKLVAAKDTNVHVDKTASNAITRQGNQALASLKKTTPQLFVLSASSEKSVLELAGKLRNWAAERYDFENYSTNLSYSLSCRRSLMQWRYSFVASSYRELMESLNRQPSKATKAISNGRVGFVFTGQGAQWFAMGRELIATQSRFAESLLSSDKILRKLGASWSLVDELLLDDSSSRVNESYIAQPAITALQIALVDLLESLGIKPQVVIGHSSGEIAAAYAAGILSQVTALKVSYCRSFVSDLCKRSIPEAGAMLAVDLGESEIVPLLSEIRKGTVSVACVNSPFSTTVSGDETGIVEAQEMLDRLNVSNRKLKVDTAYHSHHMRKVAHEYLLSLGTIDAGKPQNGVKFMSSVTAAEKYSDFGSSYWVENLVSQVRFSDTLQQYCRVQLSDTDSTAAQPFHMLIEIGPHGALAGPIRQTIKTGFDSFKYIYHPSLVRKRDAVCSILELVGKMFESGFPVDLKAANTLESLQHRFCVMHDLPTYPWDHSNTYWHESRLSKDYRMRRYPCHDLLGVRITSSTSLEPSWRHIISIEGLPWLKDHVVDDLAIFPGAGYICMAIEAIRQYTYESQSARGISKIILKNILFKKALVVPPVPAKVELQLSLRLQANATVPWYEFRIYALSEDGVWHEHCHGKTMAELVPIVAESEQSDLDRGIIPSKDELINVMSAENPPTVTTEHIYDQLRSNGNHYGPSFAAISELKFVGFQAVGYVHIPDIQSIMPSSYMQPHVIHPTTLDALMHTGLPLYMQHQGSESIMPVSIGEISVSAEIMNTPRQKLLLATTLTPNGQHSAMTDTVVYEADRTPRYEPVLTLSQAELRGLGNSRTGESHSLIPCNKTYQTEWAADIDCLSINAQSSRCPLSIQDYVKHLCFKHSQMKVLQIGWVTHSTTASFLQVLTSQKCGGIAHYHLTDISSTVLDHAQDLLRSEFDFAHFKTLDIGTSPAEQGFAEHSYDLVIAADISYTRTNLLSSLPHIHKLLKPNGHVLFRPEDRSPASEEQLNTALWQCSFSGVELIIDDFESTVSAGTMAVSKALVASRRFPSHHVVIISEKGTEAFVCELASALTRKGFSVSETAWNGDLLDGQSIYVIVDNGERPLLSKPTSEQFSRVTKLAGGRCNVFWISAHKNASAALNPEKGLITGLARSARAENGYLRFITLDVQEALNDWMPELANTITRLIWSIFETSMQVDQSAEAEYAYRNGQILIPRLMPNSNIDTWMTRALGRSLEETSIYGQPGRPLKLNMQAVQQGTTENLVFADDDSVESDLASLGRSMIEISVKAHSLIPAEVRKFLGKSKPSTPILRDYAGIVSAVGSEACKTFQIGDRVCAWSREGPSYPSCVRLDSINAHRLPDSIPLAIGAAIPLSFMTAYYSLVKIGALQRGQCVLIHGAVGNVGQAAFALAQSAGAKIFATVSSVTEREDLITRFKVPSNQIFLYKATSLERSILRSTQGDGVDVILNSLASELTIDFWTCIAPSGVYIETGRGDRNSTSRMTVPTAVTDKNVTAMSFDLANLIDRQPQKAAKLFHKVMSMLETATLAANLNITVLSIAEIGEGMKTVQARKHAGNIVVEAYENTQVKTLARSQATSQLEVNATYVIAGGSGGLGSVLCYLLASRGAKHIVVMSRRPLNADRAQKLQDSLQSFSADGTIHSLACDITNRSMVESAVQTLKNMALPPVKGVIQAAGVLQDCVLERMTGDDFQVPVQAKLFGTRYLSEAFESPHLDFFILLSSLTGTFGSRGQANYAAGNTFQDAFARSQVDSKTHYMALNLGLIEGTAVYKGSEGQTRMKNLIRQGLIPIKTEELLVFLDYAMSSQARHDHCGQAAIGIDGRSIYNADSATPTMRGPLFVHVRRPNNGEPETKTAPSKSLKQAVADAKGFVEVRDIVTAAIARKLSSLVALDYDKVSLDLPLSAFGLDSLAGIELKNWIAEELDAPIQASEILDEPSILALTMRVASRSTLVQQVSAKSSKQTVIDSMEEHKPRGWVASQSSATMKTEEDLSTRLPVPRLPLPDLRATLELYLTSARPFLGEADLKRTTSLIHDFQEGVGQQLQTRLMERAQDPEIDNWQHDLQVNRIYLKRRDPVYPYGIFYGGHLLTELSNSQAERAAVISAAAYLFKRQIDAGGSSQLQDYMNEEPLCMNTQRWLFNASRKPGVGIDEICKYPGNEYLIVLRRGHVFKVMLTEAESGGVVSYISLKLTFQAILNRSECRIPSVATLTADGRDSWAELRHAVQSIDPTNEVLLHTIEAAAFVICLDDGAPSTPTERCNQFLLGDPSNRWSDKSLQFVVCENGVSGFICEHSMLDAASLRLLNKHITEAILNHKTEALRNDTHTNGNGQNPKHYPLNGATRSLGTLADEHTFTTNAAIEGHIDLIQKQFRTSHAPAEYTHFRLPTFGNHFLRTHKLAPKAACQLVIQLASLLYYGYQHPAWEVLTMMLFHKGRLDWMQVVSPAMFTFCKAMLDDNVSAAQRNILLRKAANAHATTMTRIGRGRGFAAHLEALREVLRDGEPLPAFFADPTWEMMHVTSTRKVKTDASEGLMTQEAGFLMPDPKSMWVHYEVEDDGLLFSIQGTEGHNERFCDALKMAAENIVALLK